MGTDLFTTLSLPQAEAMAVYSSFARRGILVRIKSRQGKQALLRIGMLSVENAPAISRVREALAALCQDAAMRPGEGVSG